MPGLRDGETGGGENVERRNSSRGDRPSDPAKHRALQALLREGAERRSKSLRESVRSLHDRTRWPGLRVARERVDDRERKGREVRDPYDGDARVPEAEGRGRGDRQLSLRIREPIVARA